MTLPLLKVADQTVQFNFDQIAQRLLDSGGQSLKLRIGVTNVVWSGAVTSASKTVDHGMNSTPIAFAFVPVPGGTSVAEAQWRVTSTSSTQFVFDGTRTAVTTTDTNVAWIAIG